jgi:tetratricopeptide (TPR) repeat protein/energy-converting hydrogenase Eha subunit E
VADERQELPGAGIEGIAGVADGLIKQKNVRGYHKVLVAMLAILSVLAIVALVAFIYAGKTTYALISFIVLVALLFLIVLRAVILRDREAKQEREPSQPASDKIKDIGSKVSTEAPGAVAVGCSADGATIITGNDNQVGGSRFEQRDQRVQGLQVNVAGDYIDQRPIVATAAVGTIQQLPPAPEVLIGRDTELDELTKDIGHCGVTISGLSGMGGIGKTALALTLAHKIKDRFPDAQLYLDLKGTSSEPLTTAQVMGHVLRSFEPGKSPPEDLESLSSRFLSTLNGKRVLLLMDNARNADQVSRLKPPKECCLIVTSRWKFELPGSLNLDLKTLSPLKSRDLLLKLAPRIGNLADDLAEQCGFLPLALQLAGGALRVRKNLSPGDYLSRLKAEGARLGQLDRNRDQTGMALGVEASLALSYELLTDDQKLLWRKLAVFPGDFDEAAVATVWERDGQAVNDILGDLVVASLVEYAATQKRYRLHGLASDFARDKLTPDEQTATERLHSKHFLAVLRRADELYVAGGDNVVEGLALFDLERNNIEAGQMWAAVLMETDDDAARICSEYPNAGAYCLELRQNPHSERIPWLEAAFKAATKIKHGAAQDSHLNSLGNAYSDLGEMSEAIAIQMRRLEIVRDFGDRKGESSALGNLGNAYALIGEASKAIEFYKQSLVINRETRDRRGEGATLGNLGNAYSAIGETKKAVEYCEQALVIKREISDRRGEGNNLWNIALAYEDLGESNKAVPLARNALTIYEEIKDPKAAMVRKWLEEHADKK